MDRRQFLQDLGAGVLVPVHPARVVPRSPTPPPSYRGTTPITIGLSRQIARPRQFAPRSTFCTIAVTMDDRSELLALCESRVLSRLDDRFGRHWRVLSEHRAAMATLPQGVCDGFFLAPGTQAALIGWGCCLELCSREVLKETMVKRGIPVDITEAYLRVLFA